MMNKLYAVVENGVVINVALWDGVTEWGPGVGDVIETDGTVGPGWLYSDGVFTPPAQPEPTHEEAVKSAEQTKLSLRMNADSEIAWRQDAVSGGYATEQEETDLAEWKKYRVLLMRIDTSKAPDIEWPEMQE